MMQRASAAKPFHGEETVAEETVAFADAGNQGIKKRPEMEGKGIGFYGAMGPGK